MECENAILDLINNYEVKHTFYTNDLNNELYINQKIDKIYVINLDKDYERREYITILMEKHNINFELICVPLLNKLQIDIINNYVDKKITAGEGGCYLSHMYCLNNAKINNYKKIIIFEDDIILHKDFHNKFIEINNNTKYEILVLGIFDYYFNTINSLLINKT